MVTQSLVIAQQCAIDALEKLEIEEAASEQSEATDFEDTVPTLEDNTRRYGFPGANLSPESAKWHDSQPEDYSTPEQAPSHHQGRDKRRSVWLQSLLAASAQDSDKRLSSDSTNSKIHQLPSLLKKWTNQGEHWNEIHAHQADVLNPSPKHNNTTYKPPFVPSWLLTMPPSTSASEPNPSPWAISPFSKTPATSRFPKPDSLYATPSPSIPVPPKRRRAPPPPLVLNDDINISPPPTPPKLPLPSPGPMEIGIMSNILATLSKPNGLSKDFNNTPLAPGISSILGTSEEVELTAPVVVKDIRIGMKDTCAKVISTFIEKYDLPLPGLEESYGLYLHTTKGQHLRLLHPNVRPLVLYKTFQSEGLDPSFVLAKPSHRYFTAFNSPGDAQTPTPTTSAMPTVALRPSTTEPIVFSPRGHLRQQSISHSRQKSLPNAPGTPKHSLYEFNNFFWSFGKQSGITDSREALSAYVLHYELPHSVLDYELGLSLNGSERILKAGDNLMEAYEEFAVTGKAPRFFVRDREYFI